MCIDIVEIWFGIAIGQISPFSTELFARDTSNVSFPDDNLRKYQWIFTKLGMCIDIAELWFGLLMGKLRHFWQIYLPATIPYFRFRMMIANEFSQNVGCALILWRSVSEDISVFSFQDNKLSKFQWIFAKLDLFFKENL